MGTRAPVKADARGEGVGLSCTGAGRPCEARKQGARRRTQNVPEIWDGRSPGIQQHQIVDWQVVSTWSHVISLFSPWPDERDNCPLPQARGLQGDGRREQVRGSEELGSVPPARTSYTRESSSAKNRSGPQGPEVKVRSCLTDSWGSED